MHDMTPDDLAALNRRLSTSRAPGGGHADVSEAGCIGKVAGTGPVGSWPPKLVLNGETPLEVADRLADEIMLMVGQGKDDAPLRQVLVQVLEFDRVMKRLWSDGHYVVAGRASYYPTTPGAASGYPTATDTTTVVLKGETLQILQRLDGLGLDSPTLKTIKSHIEELHEVMNRLWNDRHFILADDAHYPWCNEGAA